MTTLNVGILQQLSDGTEIAALWSTSSHKPNQSSVPETGRWRPVSVTPDNYMSRIIRSSLGMIDNFGAAGNQPFRWPTGVKIPFVSCIEFIISKKMTLTKNGAVCGDAVALKMNCSQRPCLWPSVTVWVTTVSGYSPSYTVTVRVRRGCT